MRPFRRWKTRSNISCLSPAGRRIMPTFSMGPTALPRDLWQSRRIGNTNGILAQQIGNTTPKTPYPFPPLADAPRPSHGRGPRGLRQPARRLAVRRGADMHRLDMPFRIGAAEASGMPSGERLGKAGLKGRGGGFQTGFERLKGVKYTVATRTSPTRHLMGLVESKYFLAAAGRGHRRRNGG